MRLYRRQVCINLGFSVQVPVVELAPQRRTTNAGAAVSACAERDLKARGWGTAVKGGPLSVVRFWQLGTEACRLSWAPSCEPDGEEGIPRLVASWESSDKEVTETAEVFFAVVGLLGNNGNEP